MNDSIGIIIARFQVPKLTQGHEQVIRKVQSKHSQVVIFLGVSPTKLSKRNPLDFFARREMVHGSYIRTIPVLPLMDQESDEKWSKTLDARIKEIAGHKSVVLYGGRDNFSKYYSGKYPVALVDEVVGPCGSEVRQNVASRTINSEDFRAGVIYAKMNELAHAFPAVDVAVYTEEGLILVRQRPGEEAWGFIGGFVEPTDEDYELAAMRELSEEAGINLEVGDWELIGTKRINDWRYRQEENKIITSFYMAKRLFGNPIPLDDLAGGKLAWVKADLLDEFKWVKAHVPLKEMLQAKWKEKFGFKTANNI